MQQLLPALKAMAEDTRLRLLKLCAESELTVSEICQIVGQSQPRVSRHLKILCEAGVLDRFREGTWAFYRLTADPALRPLCLDLLSHITEETPELQADAKQLARVRANRQEAAAQYFRTHAGNWNEIRSLHVTERKVESALKQALQGKHLGDFLDIGTGTGRMLELFADRFDSGIGIDMSHDMLAMARASLEKADLKNCQVRQGDMYALPYVQDQFDTAILHQVLHYSDDPAAALREASRVLRPGGQLLVVDFAPHTLEVLRQDHQHRRLGFSDSEMAEWMTDAGLTSTDTEYLSGDPLTVVIWMGIKPQTKTNQSTVDSQEQLADQTAALTLTGAASL